MEAWTIGQGHGRFKLKSEADPDNNATTTIAGANAPHTTESIFDGAGRVVAARNNADNWTCTTYDTRGRATSVAIPSQPHSAFATTALTVTHA